MTKLLTNASPVIYLYFTEEVMKALKEGVPHNKTAATMKTLEKRLERLRNVVEVCIDMQCWIKLEPTAATWEGVAAEVERTNMLVLKALERIKNGR